MGATTDGRPLTLHLARHGETEAARDHRFCGSTDCELSELGRRQVGLVVARCRQLPGWSAVYSSPLRRCLRLAEAVGEAVGAPVTVADGLREIDHGSWDGRYEADVAREEPGAYRAYQAHPAAAGAPGGENGYQVAARALPVVLRIQEEHAGGRVLVVSHKATLRIIVCALLGIDLDRYRDRLSLPVASLTTIELKETGPLLVSLGELGDAQGQTPS